MRALHPVLTREFTDHENVHRLHDFAVARPASVDDLRPAHDILEWVAGAALPSGVLAEQLDPYTKAPLSVSPLTWSQATLVSLVHEYVRKRLALASPPPAAPATRPS